MALSKTEVIERLNKGLLIERGKEFLAWKKWKQYAKFDGTDDKVNLSTFNYLFKNNIIKPIIDSTETFILFVLNINNVQNIGRSRKSHETNESFLVRLLYEKILQTQTNVQNRTKSNRYRKSHKMDWQNI